MPLGISLRGKKKSEDKAITEPKAEKIWYKTTCGVTSEGACPLEEEIDRRYAVAGKEKSRPAIIEEIKKEWNFPKDVSYMQGFKEQPPSLMVGALNIDEAKKILMDNREVIEKYCNAKISDKIELKEF